MDQLLTDQSFDRAIHPMFESTGILAFCYKKLQSGDPRDLPDCFLIIMDYTAGSELSSVS